MTQNILFLIHRKLVFNFLKNAQVIRDLPLNCSRQKNKTKKKKLFLLLPEIPLKSKIYMFFEGIIPEKTEETGEVMTADNSCPQNTGKWKTNQLVVNDLGFYFLCAALST